MKISVICVCRNAEKTIRHTIESFLEQDYADREMVIVEGLSSDNTLEIVRSYRSPLIKVFSGKDAGIYDAMNKGFSLYTGDAAGFVNADDRLHEPTTLSAVAKGLAQADIVSGSACVVLDHDSGKVERVWKPGPFVPGAFLKGWSLPHGSTYAKREVYDRVGHYDTGYTLAADYDWQVRALEVFGYRPLVLDQPLHDMKLGGVSTSGLKASWTSLMETSRARRKHLKSGPIDKAILNRVFRKLGRSVGLSA